MHRRWTYRIVALLMLTLGSCLNGKKINWSISLKSDDKKPYGSYLAYESLKYYFPAAKIQTLSQGFRYTSIDIDMVYPDDGKALMILLGLDFYISENELDNLLEFVRSGNELVLFCSRLDSKIEQRLKCYKQGDIDEEQRLSAFNPGKNNLNALRLANSKEIYGYEGRTVQGYFRLKSLAMDSAMNKAYEDDEESPFLLADTLGFVHNKPDFIRYKIGRGHISLHAAPLVMSNYFLLQGNNKNYLTGLWATMPSGIRHIYWNEYFKHNVEASDFGVLWRYPATRWALIIAIGTLLMYVLFESKRRQRIIPVVSKPENSSVSFVETVGRLYYNKGDHHNLAEKMIQHFLEWVRLHYYLNTNELNEDFTKHLILKSGQPEQDVRRLIDLIHDIRLNNVRAEETYLYELHQLIQQFYNNHIS